MGKAARRARAKEEPAQQRPFHERRPLAVLAIATALALLPFADKALTIDDPLFVWTAQQIGAHPLDPYGFEVNWYGHASPMAEVMQNPPLTSYALALVSAVGGWNESFLHIVFGLFAFAAVAGTWMLARRMGAPPLLAAILTLVMPVFLVSSTNLMSDVAMTACFVWALALWMRGIDERSDKLLWLGMAAATAAGLFKYFGIAAMPLMIVCAAMKWRSVRWVPPLALPAIAFTAYELATKAQYGRGLLLGAAKYAGAGKTSAALGVIGRPALLLCFTGGCAIAILFFAPLLVRRRWYMAAAVVVAAAAIVFAGRPPGDTAVLVQFLIFAAAGLGVFTLAVADVVQRRDAESIVLALWVFGTAIFTAYVNWTMNGRSLLPLAPAVAILIARHAAGSRRAVMAALAATAAVALLVAYSDFRFANVQREASRTILDRYAGDGHTIWFEGHWGFQYYMQQIGGVPVDVARSTLHGKDLYVIPSTNSSPFLHRPPNHVIDTIVIPMGVPLSTVGERAHAGFYSDYTGPLPYAFGPAPDKIFTILRLGRS